MTSKELNTITKKSLTVLIELLKEDETISEKQKDNINKCKYRWYKKAIQTIINTIEQEE